MDKPNIRKAAVAGQFYPSSPLELKRQIASFIDEKHIKKDAIACILPHAGYMYSGGVAVDVVSRINIKDKIILLGPNHTGYGYEFSIMASGIWQTPLGDIKIDSRLADTILKHSKYLKEDSLAHTFEHSLEVELPILQYFRPDFEIVPITILSEEPDTLKEIGKEIATAIKDSRIENSTLIVASSDMTHYEPQAQAERKDKEAIDAILNLDEDKLIERIKRLNITMCGYAPVITMLSLAKGIGAKRAELIKYSTSADITGDTSSVVGYAGLTVY